jgi:hypothetical protein
MYRQFLFLFFFLSISHLSSAAILDILTRKCYQNFPNDINLTLPCVHSSLTLSPWLHRIPRITSLFWIFNSELDSKAAVTTVANGRHVRAYFITNLAITQIRQSIATVLECVLRPVFGPETSFMNPITYCNFPILRGDTHSNRLR